MDSEDTPAEGGVVDASSEPPGSETRPDVVLGIDLGTGGPKVALVDQAGHVLGFEVEPNELIFTEDGGVEQDPEEWWNSIVRATRRLVARDLVPVDDITLVSLTAQFLNTVPVDSSGRALHNAISWLDGRGAEEVQRLVGGPISVEGFEVRLLRRWLRYTSAAPSRSGRDPIGHILWLKKHRPELYRQADMFLEGLDYLNLRLTGKAVTCPSVIAGHWLTDIRDLSRIEYVPELFDACGFDREQFPPILPETSVIGPLAPAAARVLTLGPNVEVVTGCPDSTSAALGAGSIDPLDAHLYVGTSSWVSGHITTKKVDVFHSITTMPSPVAGHYLIAAAQESAGNALVHLLNNLLFVKPSDEPSGTADQAKADGAGDGEVKGGAGGANGSAPISLTGPPPDDVFDAAMALAATSPPGANGLRYFPWLTGERTPVDDGEVRGGFVNLGLAHTQADMVRAVLEGVAFNSRWMFGYIEKFAGQQFRSITFIGGGAQGPLWSQILCDVFDRPIRRAKEPRLANVRGAAFNALVAKGHLRWEEIPDLVTITENHEPNPDNREVYDRAYRGFEKNYKLLRKISV